jgi:hypothetical protein
MYLSIYYDHTPVQRHLQGQTALRYETQETGMYKYTIIAQLHVCTYICTYMYMSIYYDQTPVQRHLQGQTALQFETQETEQGRGSPRKRHPMRGTLLDERREGTPVRVHMMPQGNLAPVYVMYVCVCTCVRDVRRGCYVSSTRSQTLPWFLTDTHVRGCVHWENTRILLLYVHFCQISCVLTTRSHTPSYIRVIPSTSHASYLYMRTSVKYLVFQQHALIRCFHFQTLILQELKNQLKNTADTRVSFAVTFPLGSCTYVCMCAYICVCVCIYIYTHINFKKYGEYSCLVRCHIFPWILHIRCVCVRIYMYVYLYIWIYVYTHIFQLHCGNFPSFMRVLCMHIHI